MSPSLLHKKIDMWALVLIYFYETNPYVEKVSVHAKMSECFTAREVLSYKVGKGGGYFNLEQQAMCVQVSIDEKK